MSTRTKLKWDTPTLLVGLKLRLMRGGCCRHAAAYMTVVKNQQENRPLFLDMAIDHESPFKELNLKNRRITGGGALEDDSRWPRWLRPLLATRFFVPCNLHSYSPHKRECNMYCLDCAHAALCSLCLAHHRDHRTIQIRRSSYHDVIRVSEIQKVLDIAGVQTYIINSARVVFLNERPQPRPSKGVASTCEICDRSLLDSFRFCSLGCKIADPGRKKSIAASSSATSSSDRGSEKSHVTQSFPAVFTPSSAASAAVSHPRVKRRKGFPHRAPF
ncbi:hypothetical protein ZIOFF_019509 [Zingiber officinale]|uniref:PLATZ transcription factor family protein n=2 Tax=Zingiber officinale TaxID=94328 RepID=A0A8J5H7H6_ZINOF|nr:hypothetical protein ZIOFF_019509 [Zingiber officinale]